MLPFKVETEAKKSQLKTRAKVGMEDGFMITEIRKLNKAELLTQITKLAAEERKLTAQILHYLREVEARRLFAELGYGSLLDFCVKHLRYSESAAYRRISAMRLLKDVGVVHEAIASGDLSLSNAAKVQSFFQAEKKEKQKIYSNVEKQQLLKQVEQKSFRECERMLAAISPETVRKDKERVVSATETEIRFTANDQLLNKLKKLKNLLSHKNLDPSYCELFTMIADIALQNLDPDLQVRKKLKDAIPNNKQIIEILENKDEPKRENKNHAEIRHSNAEIQGNAERESNIKIQSNIERQSNIKALASATPTSKRYIPRQLKRYIWKRDGGGCTYEDPTTKIKCNSSFLMQIDHKIPLALGGKTEVNNLRLLCAAHNRLAAIQEFGEKNMRPYLRAR